MTERKPLHMVGFGVIGGFTPVEANLIHSDPKLQKALIALVRRYRTHPAIPVPNEPNEVALEKLKSQFCRQAADALKLSEPELAYQTERMRTFTFRHIVRLLEPYNSPHLVSILILVWGLDGVDRTTEQVAKEYNLDEQEVARCTRIILSRLRSAWLKAERSWDHTKEPAQQLIYALRLGPSTTHRLRAAKVRFLGDLRDWTAKDLGNIRGLTAKRIADAEDYLWRRGIGLKTNGATDSTDITEAS